MKYALTRFSKLLSPKHMQGFSKLSKQLLYTVLALVVIAASLGFAYKQGMLDKLLGKKEEVVEAKPALTVSTVKPQSAMIAAAFGASGNIAAWQEAIIGAESNGLRITDIRVNVGDVVKRGQVLATFATDTVAAELAQTRASVAEAEAALAEAQANAERAKTLEPSGALSQQQITQYVTAAKTADARLAAARANANVSQIRVAQTRVLAPDDGTISARAATVGSVVSAGQELFRIVRKNRLEWRAEVTAAELPNVAIGQKVRVITPAAQTVEGKVRVVAPTIDPQTRNVQVFVDLVANPAAKAGMFARGEFQLGESSGLTVPQQAVVIRDGFSYVFSLGADSRVKQVKVETGRRVSDRIEIRQGVDANTNLVATGAAFLKDGDLVRVTTTAAPATAPAAAKPRA
jgi:HlyD family secretion protein